MRRNAPSPGLARVWQLLLCGAQTVTLTDGIFGTVEPPAPALIVATLGAVAGAPERVEFDVFVTEGAAPPAADSHGRRMCADARRHRRRDRARMPGGIDDEIARGYGERRRAPCCVGGDAFI